MQAPNASTGLTPAAPTPAYATPTTTPTTAPTPGQTTVAPTSSLPWDVFLSHTSIDKQWVTELATQLESEPLDDTPQSRKIKVFLDIWDMQAGENIVMKLNEALTQSRFVALIMTPEFFRSNWTALEWTHCVAEDPRNTRGRMIPILYRDISTDGKEAISLPAPFRALKSLDFRTPKAHKTCYVELLNRIRGLPNPRGASRQPTPGTFPQPGPAPPASQERWAADHVSELLISNFLPVDYLPARIWSAATPLLKTKQVYDAVNSGDGVIINNHRLYTFAQLSDDLCPLRKVIDPATISDKDKRDDWLADKDKGPLYTWLLNSCLRKFLEESGLAQDEKERFFYPPATPASWDLSPSDFSNLSQLAEKLRRPTDPLCTFLATRLSSATQQKLAALDGQGRVPLLLEQKVTCDLNLLLNGESIFDKTRFATVPLRSETETLLRHPNLSPPDAIRLNRLLLEDAFPQEIRDARRVTIAGRELTGRRPTPQPGTDFWVHSAVEIRFYRIWDRYFLKIVPCFFFTHDGTSPLDGKKMGRMCIRWGGRQRNSNILRDVIFWAALLTQGHPQIRIPAGAEMITVKPLPATVRSNRGIRADHIRFSKLIRFAPDPLAEAAGDIELTPHDDDESEPPQD